jgi:hypothetical protein
MLQGIPALVVLDAKTGYVVTANGRDAVMQAISDDSRKALFQSWLTKKAVPIDQAVFVGEATGGSLAKAFFYLAKRPQYIIAIVYLVKRFLHYLETLGKEEILDQQEL